MKNFTKEIGKRLECYKYDISIIIVNYNGERYLDDLFQSLSKVAHKDFVFEVIYVDNNSTDDSVNHLKNIAKNMPFDINIIRSHDNLGFAGGNNRGAKAAKGEYLVLLNNDTVVDVNWLAELYYAIREKEDVAMVNSKLMFFYDFIKLDLSDTISGEIKKTVKLNGQDYDIETKYCKNIVNKGDAFEITKSSQICIPIWNEEQDFGIEYVVDGKVKKLSLKPEEIKEQKISLIQNAGSGINEAFDGFDIGSGEIDCEKYNHTYEINNACGASVIMRRDDFYEVGMFDSRFFMYYEDTDLSYRLKRSGRHILYCPTSIVRHIHTGSSKEWSPFFTYHVYRNKLLFIFKNISKLLYLKQLLILYRQGKRENNFYKMCGCKDSLKIIFKFKKNVTFRW